MATYYAGGDKHLATVWKQEVDRSGLITTPMCEVRWSPYSLTRASEIAEALNFKRDVLIMRGVQHE